MTNPWQDISLSDYEQHMQLDSVRQLQTMNRIMQSQFSDYPHGTLMILGVAGGNGLDHIEPGDYTHVVGVDVNAEYLEETARRYPQLLDMLICRQADLTNADDVATLPGADTIVANLLIEYIGYDCFKRTVRHVQPTHISCVIQINPQDGWVSDSPYLHAFDKLEQVHHQMDGAALTNSLSSIGYTKISEFDYPLPNGKKLVRLDFIRI